MRATFAALALAVALLGLCSGIVHAQSDEEYKVYDAVIRSMFRDGITRFDMSAKVDKILIKNRTNTVYGRSPDREDWQQVKYRLPELSEETIAGYTSVHGKEVSLSRKFDIPLPYQLISEKEIKSIFKGANDRPDMGWGEFYKKYPASGGYNSLSRVGFDTKRTQALVYFVNACGGLCATGTYVLLVKEQNGWVAKKAGMMWIS